MTLVTIDITDVVGEFPANGRVAFYSPSNRGVGGRIISTAVKYADLVDGKAEIDLVPGPVAVQIFAQGISDTRTKPGFVPDEGPVSLSDVILKWTPALVDQGILAILVAVDEALGQVSGAVAAEIGNTTHVISAGTNAHANKVVRLDGNGKLTIGAGTVTGPTDPTSKTYVDTAVNTKADRGHKHNAADITGDTTSSVNFAVDNRFADHLVKLNVDGKLTISTAGITLPTDPSNKSYVDTAVATKADRTHNHNASDIVGNTTHYVNFATDDRFAGHLVKLNSDGKLTISTAGITALTDPVNKQYTDAAAKAAADALQAKIGSRLAWWN